LPYAGFTILYAACADFHQDGSLPEFLSASSEALKFSQKTKNQIGIYSARGIRLAFSCLGGHTKGPSNFEFEGLTEATFLSDCEVYQNMNAICTYHLFKGQVLCTHGELAAAIRAFDETEPLLSTLAGMFYIADYGFYRSMAMVQSLETVDDPTKHVYLEWISKHQAWMEVLAGRGSGNWEHKYLLVEAELACYRKEHLRAVQYYGEAIELARANDFVWIQAMGHERVGDLWMAQSQSGYASSHLIEAHAIYTRLGAPHKVNAIGAKLVQLGVSPDVATQGDARKQGQQPYSALDLHSILKASQALSSEINLDKLIGKMMHTLIENAGAEDGKLILVGDGSPRVIQQASEGQMIAEVPLENSGLAPETLVRFVSRKQETVVLADASEDHPFSNDPYFQSTKAQSVLCMPILSHGKLIGLVYLENQNARDAFTEDRIEVLRLLSGQIAISIENAQLIRKQEIAQEMELRHQRAMLQATVDAQENERTRIAKDLHDDIQVTLSTAKLKLGMLGRNMKKQGLPSEETAESVDLIQDAIQSVREISQDLLPAALDRLGLPQALKELCEKVHSGERMQVAFSCGGTERRLTKDVELSIYRVTQELFANALKHAEANRVQVRLTFAADNITLELEDNGKGFELAAVELPGKGLGFKNMQGRISLVSGKFSYASEPGQGSRFVVEVPT
jgi:signal transduction histidine kinase